MMTNELCLFASEVGNLLGYNRFVESHDAIQKVVERYAPSKVDVSYARRQQQRFEAQQEFAPQLDLCETLAEVEELAATLENPTVCEEKRKELCCAVGQTTELEVVRSNDVRYNQQAFSRPVPDLHVVLYGRVDGVTSDGTLVEIKTRMKRLWRRLWPQEMAQVLGYMFISGSKSVQFIERCGEEEYRETIVWDEAQWAALLAQLGAVTASIRRQLWGRKLLTKQMSKQSPPGFQTGP